MCVCIFYILCKKYICKNLIDSSALLTAFEGSSGVREGSTEGVTAESAMARGSYTPRVHERLEGPKMMGLGKVPAKKKHGHFWYLC